MRFTHAGFTLPETLIATFILTTGLAGAAWMFTMSIGVNLDNRHRASAALLAYEKLEEFEAARREDRRWDAGGGLDPGVPVPDYSDIVTIGGADYLRLWEVTGTVSRSVSISVYVRPNGGRHEPVELIRTSTVAALGY